MQDYKYKLSIVIPLYNAEKYIRNCIEPILESDLPDDSFEIVVVDDGSTDNGFQVVTEYLKSHTNIRVCRQENQGQSVARNRGVVESNGEYIWFIDSDDSVDVHLRPVFDSLQQNQHVDILALQLERVSEEGDKLGVECNQPTLNHNKLMTGRTAVVQGYNPSSACALIMRKQFLKINSLSFMPGITHQDVELTYRAMAYAKSVIFTDLRPYKYIIHPTSTSQSTNPEKKKKYVSDEIIIIKSFRELATKMSADSACSATIYNRSQNALLGLLLQLRRNRHTWGKLGINKYVLDRLKDENLYPIRGKFDSIQKIVLAKLLNLEWLII